MTTIATTNPSIGAALAVLISGSSNLSATASAASKSTSASSGSTTNFAVSPATNVSISDQAKAILAKTQTDQAVAERLAAQVAAGKTAGKNGQASTGPTFEQIVASAKQSQAAQSIQTSQAGATSGPQDGSAPIAVTDPNYLFQEQAAHIHPDGSVTSWSQSFSDVITVPSTPKDISDWYNTTGKALQISVSAFPTSYPAGLAQALQSHSVTFLNAGDIPDLNFHNQYSYSGGFNGAQGSGNSSYNQQASIFHDPNTNYFVNADGTVLSWPKPAVAASSS